MLHIVIDFYIANIRMVKEMLIWHSSALWMYFLRMSVIAPLLAFSHFVRWKQMFWDVLSVFSRGISASQVPSKKT